MGSSLLDGLAYKISRQLTKARQDLETEQHQLAKLQRAAKGDYIATQKLWVARAYTRWRMWDKALALCDDAISAEPDDPTNYIEKSVIYALMATEKNGNSYIYQAAMEWIDKALRIDDTCGRAYYDRAVYKQLMSRPKQEVLTDLKRALETDEMIARVVMDEPALKELREDEEFKKLIYTVIIPQKRETEKLLSMHIRRRRRGSILETTTARQSESGS